MMYDWNHHGTFGPAGWIWMIVMFLFWVAVAVLIVWAIRALISSSSHNSQMPAGPREDSAMRILRERYARGEIDTEQFERARQTLEGHGPSPA